MKVRPLAFACIRYLECFVGMIKAEQIMLVDASWLTFKKKQKLSDFPISMEFRNYFFVLGLVEVSTVLVDIDILSELNV